MLLKFLFLTTTILIDLNCWLFNSISYQAGFFLVPQRWTEHNLTLQKPARWQCFLVPWFGEKIRRWDSTTTNNSSTLQNTDASFVSLDKKTSRWLQGHPTVLTLLTIQTCFYPTSVLLLCLVIFCHLRLRSPILYHFWDQQLPSPPLIIWDSHG